MFVVLGVAFMFAPPSCRGTHRIAAQLWAVSDVIIISMITITITIIIIMIIYYYH